MSKHPSIDLVIFDLGRVLVDFDFKKVVRGLQRYSPHSEKQIRRFFETTPLWDQFERGLIQPEAFFKALQKATDLRLGYEAFIPLWNNIFVEKHDTVSLVKQLKGHYRLAMLSNVNIMHWNHIWEHHTFMEWFDFPIASYAVGHRKPKAEIYHHVLQRTGIPGSRAVFIDDVYEHIIAAQSIGIRAHQFYNAVQLRQDIADLLE